MLPVLVALTKVRPVKSGVLVTVTVAMLVPLITILLPADSKLVMF